MTGVATENLEGKVAVVDSINLRATVRIFGPHIAWGRIDKNAGNYLPSKYFY